MMITICFVFFVFIAHAHTVHSDCPFIDICTCDRARDQIICDGGTGNDSETNIPSMNNLPSVPDYFFSNFKEVQTDAFENATFLSNCSIKIHLTNIATIHPEAFSTSMVIPDDSTLSIEFDNSDDIFGLILNTDAFNNISINQLLFLSIDSFNGGSIFDTRALGAELFVKELIFEKSDLTGFISDGEDGRPTVEHLCIRNCPSLKRLTADKLPSFLQATKTFEVSGTGLQSIDNRLFEAWDYDFERLLIKNNAYLSVLPQLIVGPAQSMNTLDLSNNSITSLTPNYEWYPYFAVKHLILKQQRKLDLFIKSDILKSMEWIKSIDFSQGIISENDENLINDHIPSMPTLASINISHTNFTDNMVIDLLTVLSNSANQTIEVSLLNHTLNGTNFCRYYQIFKQAPNLLRLELDKTHECNCIVDLFYDEEHAQLIFNDTLMEPACVLNSTRGRCDIQQQLILSQCSVGQANPDDPGDSDMGTLAFAGTMAGLTIVLLALLALGSSVIYRARRGRLFTILDMEDPVENVSDATVDGPLEASGIQTMREPIQNSF